MKVPAYVVFDDATLGQLAARLPTTEASLLSIRVIGPAKLDAYGSELLDLAGAIRADPGPSGPGPSDAGPSHPRETKI
jgi:superfamily II DNA helicase RecQ